MAATSDLADLVRIEDPDFYDDTCWALFARMRREDPCFFYEPLEVYVLTKYEDIRLASRQPEVFTTAAGVMLNHIRYMDEGLLAAFHPEVGEPIMFSEPPRHRELRRFLAPSFTPTAINKLEETVRRLSCEIIDTIVPEEPLPFVSQIGAVLPIQVIAALMGLPTDDAAVAQLRYWSDEVMKQAAHLDVDELHEAAANVRGVEAFLDEWCLRKRNDPSDELIPTMLRGCVGDEPASYEMLHSMLRDILVAGNETTRDYLSGSLYAYAQFPDQLRRLQADPSLSASAAEECLRWVTPVRAHTRKVIRDTEIRGQAMREGQHALLVYMSGNRDEDIWDRPDVFDIARPLTPHVAFGFGEHACVGAAVARLEGRIFFEELSKRFSSWEIAGEPVMPPSVLHNAFEELPVVFHP